MMLKHVPLHPVVDEGWCNQGRMNLLFQLRNLIVKESSSEDGGSEDASLVFVNFAGRRREWEEARMDYYNYNNKMIKTPSSLSSCLNDCPTLVTLKYVEGLKYTLGSRYTSREVDGEFIFLRFEDGDDEHEHHGQRNYVELECRDGFFWVSSKLQEASTNGSSSDEDGRTFSVAVNGTVLSTPEIDSGGPEEVSSSSSLFIRSRHGNRKLSFGDVISICLGGGGAGRRGYGTVCDLILKPSTLSTSRDDVFRKGIGREDAKCDPDSHRALQNPLILSKILESLPVATIKHLRLVSHIWNEEALKLIRPHVTLTIFKTAKSECHDDDPSSTSLDYHPPTSDLLMEISNLAHSSMISQHNAKFPSVSVNLPFVGKTSAGNEDEVHRNEDELVGMLKKKFMDDLRWFLSPPFQIQNHITELSLHGVIGIGLEPNLKPFALLLSRLSSSLTSLHLSIKPDPSSHWDEFDDTAGFQESFRRFRTSIEGGELDVGPMMNLKALTVSPCAPTCISMLLWLLLFEKIPNVQTLHILSCPTHSNLSYYTTSYMYLALMPRKDDNNSLSSCALKQLSDLGMGVVSTGMNRIISPTIKRLTLMSTIPEQFEKDVWEALCCVQDTLEEVVLHCQDIIGSQLNLSFPPQMKKLKSLSLLIHFDLLSRSTTTTSTVVGLRFGDMDSPTRKRMEDYSYRSHFPSLSTLVLWPVDEVADEAQSLSPLRNSEAATWRAFSPILEAFIPSSQPATSVTTLDIPFLLKEGLYHGVLDGVEAAFPNVPFSQDLQDARTMDRETWSDRECPLRTTSEWFQDVLSQLSHFLMVGYCLSILYIVITKYWLE